MTAAISTRFPPLPPETLRAKAAHLTVGGCMVAIAGLFLWSAWDEVNCVAGEMTSSGPCGIGLTSGGTLAVVGIGLLLIGGIVLFRGLRRPIGDRDAGDGWRIGQAVVVMVSGAVLALMIPRYACPADTTLSPVFHYCVNPTHNSPAPSPGLPWKFAAVGVGIAIGVLLIRWRSMPWWLASIVVVAASLGSASYVLWRTTGIPVIDRSYVSRVVVFTVESLTALVPRAGPA